MSEPGNAPRPLRSLFLSDLHLGARGARPEKVLEFLQGHEAETIYLVGDIFDIWAGRPVWGEAHTRIITLLLDRARAGTRIVYLPGNHDPVEHRADSEWAGLIEITGRMLHTAADGRRYLVLHGDCCDARPMQWHFMTRLGSWLDWGLRTAEARLRGFRRELDPDVRGPVEALIDLFNAALRHGNRFEGRLVAKARASGADGVICGHFHKAALHVDHGLIYANCGDWLDSFTAIAEEPDGRLRLLGWAAEVQPEAGWTAEPAGLAGAQG
ncbi:MAG: UDP-2,3-diacylglucosamine diphosphatase [Paracoccaceae bacterium]